MGLDLVVVDVHGVLDKNSFNLNYTAIILLNSSLNNLAVNEHLMIHRLKCIKPFELNSNDPFGIPLLNIYVNRYFNIFLSRIRFNYIVCEGVSNN